MGIISVEQADHLYWLGRYTERVYTTLNIFSKRFDALIDGAINSYEDFCRSIDIPVVYADKSDFVKNYPFDNNNPDSIISNLIRAHDNAITLRESIGSETLAYIQLAIYEMNKAEKSKSPMIELQKVNDNLLAFYGTVDDQIDSENVRNIIKAGRRIERIDLYARLGLERKEIVRQIHRLIPRLERSGLEYDAGKLSEIERLIEEDNIDYYKIVSDVETIL